MSRLLRHGLLVLGLALSACGQQPVAAAPAVPAATVEAIPGSDLKRVQLSQQAAERLGLATVPVARRVGTGTSVPYAAVLYDADGTTWAFTNPEPLVFIREQIVVERIEDEIAVLSDGPAPGTLVVTVGGAELMGVESGIGGGH